MSGKLTVEFVSSAETSSETLSNFLITQLMTTVTQIGIRVDNPDNDAIIENGEEHDKED